MTEMLPVLVNATGVGCRARSNQIELGSGVVESHCDDKVIIQKHQRVALLDRHFWLENIRPFFLIVRSAASATAFDRNAIANIILNGHVCLLDV
jgi:hypothetical protein